MPPFDHNNPKTSAALNDATLLRSYKQEFEDSIHAELIARGVAPDYLKRMSMSLKKDGHKCIVEIFGSQSASGKKVEDWFNQVKSSAGLSFQGKITHTPDFLTDKQRIEFSASTGAI